MRAKDRWFWWMNDLWMYHQWMIPILTVEMSFLSPLAMTELPKYTDISKKKKRYWKSTEFQKSTYKQLILNALFFLLVLKIWNVNSHVMKPSKSTSSNKHQHCKQWAEIRKILQIIIWHFQAWGMALTCADIQPDVTFNTQHPILLTKVSGQFLFQVGIF